MISIIDSLREEEEFSAFIQNLLKEKSEDADLIIKDYQKYASWTVKFNLLRESMFKFKQLNNEKRPSVILELASGRGNDLNRWLKLKVPNVIGIEVDPEQYEEANKRLHSSNAQVKRAGSDIKYVLGSALSLPVVSGALKKTGGKADIVVCNFALNYFFKDQETIDKFFTVLTSSMRSGSLFIGTCADGDVIDYLLKSWGPIDNYVYKLNSSNKDNCYEIALKTPYFEEGTKVYTEYLVNKNELIEICKKHKLFPIKIDKYDPVINFNYIGGYEHGPVIRILYFRFSFVYRP